MSTVRLTSFVLSLFVVTACDGARAPYTPGGSPADVPGVGLDGGGTDAAAPDAGALPDTPLPLPDTAPPGPDVSTAEDVQWPPVCCDTDADCPDGKLCVGAAAGVQGQCRMKGCYGAEGCPEHHVCIGSTTCACGDDCLSMKGHCAPLDAGCCGPDLACPDGTQCVPQGTAGSGTCAPVPSKPWKCWSDGDCAAGQTCLGAQLCPCDADCDQWNKFGYCEDTAFAECVAKHSDCGCEPGCADGFWAVAYYPAGAGPFPPDTWSPEDLLDIAVAWYGCSICTCQEAWHLKVDGVWNDGVEGGADEFCTFLLDYQDACGGCLETWEGGCC